MPGVRVLHQSHRVCVCVCVCVRVCVCVCHDIDATAAPTVLLQPPPPLTLLTATDGGCTRRKPGLAWPCLIHSPVCVMRLQAQAAAAHLAVAVTTRSFAARGRKWWQPVGTCGWESTAGGSGGGGGDSPPPPLLVCAVKWWDATALSSLPPCHSRWPQAENLG